MTDTDGRVAGTATIVGLPLDHDPAPSRLDGVAVAFEGIRGYMLVYAWSTEPLEGAWLELLVTQGDLAVVQAAWPTMEAARRSATRRGQGARLLGGLDRGR